MKFFTLFTKIFLICFTIVNVYLLFAAWNEAGAIGYLDGTFTNKISGFFRYWLFWIILYTGPTFLIVTLVLALLLTLVVTIVGFVKKRI